MSHSAITIRRVACFVGAIACSTGSCSPLLSRRSSWRTTAARLGGVAAIGLAFAASPLLASTAQGATKTTTTKPSPVPPALLSGTLPAYTGQPNTFCAGFAVDYWPVVDGEYTTTTTLRDGTQIIRVWGPLVLAFKNDTTKKTIVRDVGGPTKETLTNPENGIGTYEGTGKSWFAFGPQGQVNTGEPGLFFTNGLVTFSFNGDVVSDFSLHGTQVNGCALLA